MTVSEEVRSANTKREGWLLKGSDIVNGVTCRRYGVLSKDSFETYRQESDPKPSSVWPLHPKCEVTPLDRKELTIRAKGRSTIVALVAGKYEKLDGYSFSVLWPTSHATKTSRVLLGFEEETTAARWQTCFLEAIQNLGVIPKSEYKPIVRSTSETVASSELENSEVCYRELTLQPDKVERPLPPPILPVDSDAENSMRTESAKEATPKNLQPSRDLRVASSSTCTTSDIHDRPPQIQGNETECYWCPWKHVNGVAVYREDVGNSRDGAFMVSTIVRAPPAMCFKALMSRSATRSNLTSGFFDMEVLEELADDMQIVHARMEATGWVGRMLAPREITAERSWRLEEEDGTYVVLLQSTNKHVVTSEQDKSGGFFGWAYSPVEAQVQAAGFTIAPLQEKYCPDPTKSPESLVTMVLKIDLGGICSSNSWLGSATSVLGIREAWIESMLMTVVCLKDRVEQSRFVTLPFTIGSGVGGSQQPHQRTSTQLCRDFNQTDAKPTPESNSVLDQQETKQESAPGSPVHRSPRQKWENGTLSRQYYSCPGAAGFKLRGKNYLQDRKKILAPEPEFDLKSVDLVKLDKPTPHVSRYLESIRCSTAGFTYVVQIMVPGPPHLGLVMAWSSKDDASMNRNEASSNGSQKDTGLDSDLTPFEIALMRFVSGDDDFRNDTFKLIPHIVKGSWIIRQSVGSTPVLLGNKLKQYYHRGPRYIEVDIDVGSSYTAASVVGLVSGATKSLCVDLAILTEGNSAETLPEALVGTVRFDRLDLTEAIYLDTSKEIEPREVSTPKEPSQPSVDGMKGKKDEEMGTPKIDS